MRVKILSSALLARVIEKADTETLNSFIREAISEKVSLIATDDHPGYRKLKRRRRAA